MLHSGQSTERFGEVLVETDLLIRAWIFLLGQVEAKGQYTFVRETGIERLEAVKTAQEQAGADEEEEGYGDFRDDQTVPQASASSDHGASGILEDVVNIGAAGEPGGGETKSDPGQQ